MFCLDPNFQLGETEYQADTCGKQYSEVSLSSLGPLITQCVGPSLQQILLCLFFVCRWIHTCRDTYH